MYDFYNDIEPETVPGIYDSLSVRKELLFRMYWDVSERSNAYTTFWSLMLQILWSSDKRAEFLASFERRNMTNISKFSWVGSSILLTHICAHTKQATTWVIEITERPHIEQEKEEVIFHREQRRWYWCTEYEWKISTSTKRVVYLDGAFIVQTRKDIGKPPGDFF